jgi:hypothetical protein
VVAVASLLGSLAAAAAAASTAPRLLEMQRMALLARRIGPDLSAPALRRFAAGMDPGAQAIAARYDPASGRLRPAFAWGRPGGGLPAQPDGDPGQAPASQALTLNQDRPVSDLPNPPARPFALAAPGALALTCLTAAVYYEAASEGEAGQAAVAQVVLNRVRHPMFPKSVCGVVFQGSEQRAGCQFTFACDGALDRRPDPAGWARAERVAARALGGYVMKAVGEATHYHAEWVSPAWSGQMVKLAQVGAHIFYRWSGPAGRPAAFTAAYAGEGGQAPARLMRAGLLQPERDVPEPGVEAGHLEASVIAPATVSLRPAPAAPRLEASAPPRIAQIQTPAYSMIAREDPRPAARLALPSDW